MSNTGVEFTKEELKSLIEDEKSCVHLKRCKYSLALYPCHLENFKDSIKELLNQKKARYEKELGGILLGYKNIKLLSSNGAIMNDSCHVHIEIEADFYVFKPEIGSVVKGIVNKVSEYHLGCLVHRLFNISVHKQDAGENWLGYFVDIGHEVVLNVTHIDLHSRLPFIRASLDEKQFENTNATKIRKNATNEEILNQNQDEITETPISKHKKHKIENDLSLELDESNFGKPKKKKHKKSKKTETEITELDNKYEELKKIKHKHKVKDKIPEITIENGDSEHKKHKKKHKSKDKDHDNEQFDVINAKKDKRKSLEIVDQKQIKEENNLSIKKRDSLPNGIVKTEHASAQEFKSFTDLSFHSPITAFADHEDRKTKKKRNSQSNSSLTNNISIDDLKLDLHDSELEKLLNDSSSKKKKKKKDKERDELMKEENSFTETTSSKKRKREEISDEEIVKKHKKKKRHSITEET